MKTRILTSLAVLGTALVWGPAAHAAPAKKSAKPAATATKSAKATKGAKSTKTAGKKPAKPTASAAKKAERVRVAILASGPLASEARAALEAEVRRRSTRYELVPESQVRAAAARRGMDPTAADGASSVARDLGLAAVLVADTSGPAGRQQLRLTVREGDKGRALASPAAARVAGARQVPAAVKKQWPALDKALGKARAPAPEAPAPLEPATPLSQAPTPLSPPPASHPGPAARPAPTPPASSAPPATASAATPAPRKPVTATPKPPERKEPEAPSETPAVEGAKPLVVEAALGLRLFGRTLRYKDDIYEQLRPYTLGKDVGGFALPGAPQVSGAFTVYPMAAFSPRSGLARLGLTGSLDRSLVLKSTGSTGALSYPTVASEWQLGLRYLLPLGAGRHAADFSGTFVQHSFRLDPSEDGTRPADLPNVAYQGAELSAGLRLALSQRLDLGLRLGYLQPLSAGELSSDEWFPRASMGAVTGSLAVAYRLTPMFDVRLTTDLRRYFFKFKPEVGDPRVAGGAVDQYPGVSLQLGFRR